MIIRHPFKGLPATLEKSFLGKRINREANGFRLREMDFDLFETCRNQMGNREDTTSSKGNPFPVREMVYMPGRWLKRRGGRSLSGRILRRRWEVFKPAGCHLLA
jgi:hypothetical protein